MEIAAGRRLGPYEIVSRIGAGGMGEVWKGRDTRLERSVAIKILPGELASNPQFRSRFEREAKTISQLNHTHICTLYDVGHEDGVDFLVMELLEGESLADRIARGPLPLHEVLRFGQQIAEALDKAHRQGVVHRDLKPANVMLTKAGAKLLDFGLAKIAQPEVSLDDLTQQKPLTREGTIVGTFQYMSPEQLEGEEADARTDIFSLGAVLFEMATGVRAFDGKTKTSLIAAIVSSHPQPVSQVQPLAPPALDHIIHKCLEKDRDDRWQSAHDIAEELKWLSTAGSQAGVGAPVIARRKRRELGLYAAVALLLVAASTLAFFLTRKSAPAMVYRASLVLPSNMNYYAGAPAISPDGSTLAYSAPLPGGESAIWIRKFNEPKSRLLEGTTGGRVPFWSPDGRFIGYAGPTKLMKVAVTGGQSEELAAKADPWGASWNEDGVILYTPGREGPIFRTSTSGGEPKPVTDPKALGHRAHLWPTFLPDQKRFLFLAVPEGDATKRSAIWIASLDPADKPAFVVNADTNCAYVRDGYLFHVRDGILRAQRFDPKSGKVEGDAISISPIQISNLGLAAYFAVSETGTLVYVEQGSEDLSELVWLDRQGRRLGNIGVPGYYWSPRLSRDERKVAIDKSDSSGKGDIWLVETERPGLTRLTFDPSNESSPAWSYDNRTVFYFITSGGTGADLSMVSVAGGEPKHLTATADRSEFLTDVSPDGTTLAVEQSLSGNQRAQTDIALLSLATKTVTPFLASPAAEGAARFSPDGKWLAYVSDENGRMEVFVQSNPPGNGKWQISTAGGTQPCWSHDGKELFYLSTDTKIMSVAISTGTGFEAATPVSLFAVSLRPDTLAQFDVSRDGRFLVNSIVPRTDTPTSLVTDWRALFVKE
ncbi:MAG: protein kinase [Thermoanaerobaculia bacterium]|nr:protein kinase [Thermoanaerobaculia bacterium]